MDRLAALFGLNFGRPAMPIAKMNESLMRSDIINQRACDVLNESRRKDGLPMLRCGEGLPSWEGQLTDSGLPSWEGYVEDGHR